MHRFFLPNFQQPVLSAEEAHHAKHVSLVRRDSSKPDFPSGDYTSTFEGSAGGRPFTVSCVHRVP